MKKAVALCLLMYSSHLIARTQCDIQISESALPAGCHSEVTTYPCNEDNTKMCWAEGVVCPNPAPKKDPEPPKQPQAPPQPGNDPEPAPEPAPEPEAPNTPTPSEPEGPPETPPPEPTGPEPEPSDFLLFQKDDATANWKPKKIGTADCSNPAVKCVERSPTFDTSSLLEISLKKGSLGCSQGRCRPVEVLPAQTASVLHKLKAAAGKKGGCWDPKANCTHSDDEDKPIRDSCGRLITPIQKTIVIDLKNVLKGFKPYDLNVKLTPKKPAFSL